MSQRDAPERPRRRYQQSMSSQVLTVRVSDDDYRQLSRAAELRGISPGHELLRRAGITPVSVARPVGKGSPVWQARSATTTRG